MAALTAQIDAANESALRRDSAMFREAMFRELVQGVVDLMALASLFFVSGRWSAREQLTNRGLLLIQSTPRDFALCARTSTTC